MVLLAGALAGAARPAAAQRIDSIVVLNEDVFAREEEQAATLARLANALHFRTRATTIRRTLLLNQGDAYDSARVVESERALRGLSVFRQVALDTAWVGDRLYLLVVTGDGWSTRPELNFSTAAGDATWSIGLNEENFLGTATELGLSYLHSVDRNSLELSYRNPHFFARRAIFFARYADQSDGARGAWRIGLPFAQTAARHAIETNGEAHDGRVLVFAGGNDSMPKFIFDRQLLRFTVRGGIALHATSREFIRLWGAASVRREDYVDTLAVMTHSTFGAFGVGIDFGRTRFQILRQFNSYARREDLDLSSIARVGISVAPAAWGYPGSRAGIGPDLYVQTSTLWRKGFGVLRAAARGIFAASGLDSGRANIGVTFGSQNFPGQSLVLHAEIAAAHKPNPSDYYDFWSDRSGPRLFGAHAYTGTRLFWVTLEDRIVLDDDVYGMVGVGIAPFIDWGGAWFTDEGPRTGGNIGLALRLGPTRSIQGDPAEIAFGVRFGDGVEDNRWALTIRRALRF
jgi:hypothetical protein